MAPPSPDALARLRVVAVGGAVGGAVAVAVGGATACVDLFHSTDFQTLCTVTPTDPACGGGAVDAGDAASDRRAPAPDFCAWSPAEAERRAEHACAWLGACEGPLEATKLGTCIARARLVFDCAANPALRPEGPTADLWACLAEAATCAAVDACIFPGGVQTCPAVPSGNVFTTCNAAGTVRVQCSSTTAGRPTGADPCVLEGRTCTKRNDSVADCTGIAQKSCAGAPKCSGTSAVVCGLGGDSTIDRGFDCASVGGGRCVLASSKPACAPLADAGPCAADAGDGVVLCDGARATTCVDGRAIAIGCDAIGTPCTAEAGAPHAPESACAFATNGPCTADDSCRGSVLTSCASGASHQVDCAAQGLGPCRILPSALGQCSPP